MQSLSEQARAIFARTVAACRGDRVVEQTCRRKGSTLDLAGLILDLGEFQRVHIFGAGKASVEMASGLASMIPEIETGLLVTKNWNREFTFSGEVIEAGHPEPNEQSILAGTLMLERARQMTVDDFVIFALSGGASALLEAPKPPLSLEDIVETNRVLLASGLPIAEMNAIRKRLSLVKNGGLARAFGEATVVCLVLSDVIGDDLHAIGSAPLISDESNQALPILPKLPAAVRMVLSDAPTISHTRAVPHRVIANGRYAAQSAANFASDLGFCVEVDDAPFEGEAAKLGVSWAVQAHNLPPNTLRVCFGESTVTLGAKYGQGGRCQEAALAAALEIAGMQDVAILVAGTDGVDGVTDYAGAVVDGNSVSASRLDAKQLLVDHNSARFHEATGSSITTGPTGTNLNELAILLHR